MAKASGSLVIICSLLLFLEASQAAPLAPALYVFGDSTVDAGNNNLNDTYAKSDFLPYGIDFPGGILGRPTNGYNMADFFARWLGLNLPPAFRLVDIQKYNICQGFNYASSSAGILNETAKDIFKGIISLNEQVDLFRTTVQHYLPVHLKSQDRISQHLSKSIFLVVMGVNDIGLNFVKKVNSTHSHLYARYLDVAIEKLGNDTKDLYEMGARKFVVFEVEALGCLPQYVNKLKPKNSICVKHLNKIAVMFNKRLRLKLKQLGSDLKGSTFVTGKYYDYILSIVKNPRNSGLKYGYKPCCALLPFGICDRTKPPCKDRNSYAFFDAYHPTQAAYKLFAHKCFSGHSGSCLPINIRQLAKL